MVRLFFSLQTQWRFAGMGQVAGLDYAAIPPTAAMMGITLSPDLFDGLRDMENEALQVFNERN